MVVDLNYNRRRFIPTWLAIERHNGPASSVGIDLPPDSPFAFFLYSFLIPARDNDPLYAIFYKKA
jgi:hypothetical protein